jgi:TPR repeat protein
VNRFSNSVVLADRSNNFLSLVCAALSPESLVTNSSGQSVCDWTSRTKFHSARRLAVGRGGQTVRGVETALIGGAKYFKLAADQNYAVAQFNYGNCLAKGEGVPLDLIEAAKYYKLAADQNYARGQFTYGWCLEYGLGIEKDLIEAAQYFKLSADQNLAHGQVYYGACLEEGKGVKVDLVEAV